MARSKWNFKWKITFRLLVMQKWNRIHKIDPIFTWAWNLFHTHIYTCNIKQCRLIERLHTYIRTLNCPDYALLNWISIFRTYRYTPTSIHNCMMKIEQNKRKKKHENRPQMAGNNWIQLCPSICTIVIFKLLFNNCINKSMEKPSQKWFFN